MMGKYKIHGRTLVSIAILLALAIIIPLYVKYTSQPKARPVAVVPEMVFADPSKGVMYITDSAGQEISRADYPKSSSLGFQAVAPNGGVLVSVNGSWNNASFVYTRNNASKVYSGNTAVDLNATPLIDGSYHQIFFVDNKTVLLVACNGPSSACRLEEFNLSNGTAKKIVDLGVNQPAGSSAQAYLVGLSRDKNVAFLRVIGAKTSLGKLTNAVYRVDVNVKKAIGTISLPALSSQAVTLSPDENKLVYTTTDSKRITSINSLDLSTNKTQKIAWDDNNGLLPNNPNAFIWSLDSKKLLFQSTYINIPGQVPKPTVVAYADLSKDGSVSIVRQVKDPAREAIYGLGWLDDNTIAFQVKKSSNQPDPATAPGQTFKQPIGGNASTLKVPDGILVRALNY